MVGTGLAPKTLLLLLLPFAGKHFENEVMMVILNFKVIIYDAVTLPYCI